MKQYYLIAISIFFNFGVDSSSLKGDRIAEQLDLMGVKVGMAPKFGQVPTNRVLPVDQLTEADYEDQQFNEIIDDGLDNQCGQILREDLLKFLKRAAVRIPREEEEVDLLQSYLDLDAGLGSVMGPLLNMLQSAMARNATAIDQHYKKLPSLLKTEVTDVISIFTQLLKI